VNENGFLYSPILFFELSIKIKFKQLYHKNYHYNFFPSLLHFQIYELFKIYYKYPLSECIIIKKRFHRPLAPKFAFNFSPNVMQYESK